MVVVNAFFMKPEKHVITHQSGGHCSQIDYVLLRKKDLKVSKNIKVWRIRTCALALSVWSVTETVTTQHQKCTPKLHIWKLKDQTCKTEFSSEINEALQTVSLTDSVEESWLNLNIEVTWIIEKVCGWSKKVPPRKHTWWWNNVVGSAIQENRRCRKYGKRLG